MAKNIQKRTLQTRAKLINASKSIVADRGYQGLRVDDVVKMASVAKGTFFAHFQDKDALMEILVGAEIDRCLDQIEILEPPNNLEELINALGPLISLLSSERYVFELVSRQSGARSIEEIGPISTSMSRQILVCAKWIKDGPFRNDIPTVLIAEGMQAFLMKALSLKFCALNKDEHTSDVLKTYLDAWLMPYSLQ